MLETLREYALEQLDRQPDAAAVLQRHANHFLALAEQAGEALRIGMLRWVERLQADLDNLRAALAWFRDSGNTDLELRLAAALSEFWLAREYYDEGLRAVESALDARRAAAAAGACARGGRSTCLAPRRSRAGADLCAPMPRALTRPGRQGRGGGVAHHARARRFAGGRPRADENPAGGKHRDRAAQR
jgi:hypothetical protein